jgi:hypothetical protein
MYTLFVENRLALKREFIKELDVLGFYDDTRFKEKRFIEWVNTHTKVWPRSLKTGKPKRDVKTLERMLQHSPELSGFLELQQHLSKLKDLDLPLGPDSRNRTDLKAYFTLTARNAPKAREFILAHAKVLRGLIRPEPVMVVINADYKQQEIYVAASLSGDPKLLQACQSGDVYVNIGKALGRIPPEGTPESHPRERDQMKTLKLGIIYGRGYKSIAAELGIPEPEALGILRDHKRTYPQFWRWVRRNRRKARGRKYMQTRMGWRVRVTQKMTPQEIQNWPVQSTAADVFRLACSFLNERGIRLLAPLHDSILVEANEGEEEAVKQIITEEMERAAEIIIGLRIPVDQDVIHYPDRLLTKKTRPTWDRIVGVLQKPAVDVEECSTMETGCFPSDTPCFTTDAHR